MIAASLLLTAVACNSTPPVATQSPRVATQTLTTDSSVLFQHDLYDYGASIIQEGNIRKYWWCGQDPTATDAIFYRSYDSSTGQYSPILQVLTPNGGLATWDRSYICDPSVIKGQFINPDNTQTYSYAMYYTATDRGPGTPFAGTSLDGTNNRIGIAYSNDGIAWNRYSANPIIYPQVYPTDTYGAGQAATYSNNGIAGIQIFYSDFTNASSNLGERLYSRTSNDGRTFGAPTLISNQGVLPNRLPNMGNADFAFDSAGRYWYLASALSYSEAQGYRGDRERYQFGLYRMTEAAFPSGSWELLGYVDTNLTGATINHNTSLVRDQFGNVNVTSPNIETVFSQGSNAVNDWDLASVRWNPNPATSELKRYSSANTNTFIVTTGFVPSGYALQNTVATLYNGRVAGTQPLYACKTGSTDYFVSLQLNCEGYYPLGVNGFIYLNQPSTPSTVALYRCFTGVGHFVSLQSNCEGSSNEGLLGYALGTGGTQPPTAATLTNAGLETPTVSGLQYAPSGATWSFASVAGIQRNGSAFGAATAPDGLQTAFLQGSSTGLGSMSQTVTLTAGSYTLKFKAAQRSGQVQPLKISVDSVQVGSNITSNSNSFADYSSSTFTVAAGSHVVKVEATNASGDNTVFLDDFSLQTSAGNLALSKPVSSNNSLESSQWGVAKITDGVLDSQATSQGFTSNQYSGVNVSGNPVYVEVDLGSNQNVGSVKLYPRTGSSAVAGGSPNFPVNFTVQVAVDGSSTYATVATVTAQANPNGVAQAYSFAATSARRIRILVTGLGSPANDEPTNYRFQLSEVSVF